MLKVEIRADFLKAAIAEDRQEIRLLKDRIYQIAALITVSSFAVTAFVLGSNAWAHRRLFLVLTDAAFLVFLWASFLPLKRDLDGARKCLEAREEMIPKLATDEGEPFQPYPVVPLTQRARVTENGLYWLLSLATCALVLKIIVVYWEMA
jgi:hypothetical protein